MYCFNISDLRMRLTIKNKKGKSRAALDKKVKNGFQMNMKSKNDDAKSDLTQPEDVFEKAAKNIETQNKGTYLQNLFVRKEDANHKLHIRWELTSLQKKMTIKQNMAFRARICHDIAKTALNTEIPRCLFSINTKCSRQFEYNVLFLSV